MVRKLEPAVLIRGGIRNVLRRESREGDSNEIQEEDSEYTERNGPQHEQQRDGGLVVRKHNGEREIGG